MSEGRGRLAIVMAGGGARGAYEVGVLSYLFGELQKLRGRSIPVDVICGTSVGAINSAFLASHLEDSAAGVEKLVELWLGLELDNVLGFGWKQARALASMFKSNGTTGLVDVTPMAQLIGRRVPWSSIGRNLRAGKLRALSITCTEVHSGRTVLFLQTGPSTSLPTHAPPRTLIRGERIGPQHVLASAAIPILFPPVRVGRQLYVDGGLRHNTPIAPALRMGATHLFVIGTSRQVRGILPEPDLKEPSTSFVLGKIMNALLLDHLENDLAQVALVNEILKSSERAFGDGHLERLNRAAVERGGRPIGTVETLVVRPSLALSAIGGEYLRGHRVKTNSVLTRRLLSWLDSGKEADLASYLLFDGGYARQLIELGRADARARRDQILDFLESLQSPTSVPPPPAGDWSFQPPVVG